MSNREIRLRHTAGESSLQERLRARLAAQFAQAPSGEVPRSSALLLDTSGSMNEYLGANVRKVDELRKLARMFPGVRRFQFATTAEELPDGQDVGQAMGGTALDIALLTMKGAGISHVVLITDGKPDNKERAFQAAQGLKIDCFYVGPDPQPPFLEDLCRATGGSYGKASLDALRALHAGVRERLLLGVGR